MRLRSLIAILVAATVALLAAPCAWLIHHDRAALLHRMTSERQGVALELAAAVEDRLASVRSDLHLLAALVDRGDKEDGAHFETEFGAVLAAGGRYEGALAMRPDGRRVLWLNPRRSPEARAALVDLLGREAETASGGADRPWVEVPCDGQSCRATALRVGEVTVALAVDVADLLHDARAYARRAGGARVFLRRGESGSLEGVDEAGRRVAAAAPALASGSVLDEGAAAVLGLPGDAAVISTAPLGIDGRAWQLVLVSSLQAVAAEQRAATLRAGLIAGGVMALMLPLALLVLRQERRQAVLTERLRLQDELIRAEKLATVGVLSAGIAHEIGTPMAVVRATAERELRRSDEPARRAALATIVDEIDRVSRIVRGLLDFSRGKTVDQRVAVALGPVMRTTVDLLRPVADQSGVEIATALEGEVPALMADPDQLQQVLVNLLVNACDACAGSSRPRQVELRAHGRGATVEILVRDSGCGIPEDQLNRIFDPFFTTKKRGEGTGLGLSVAAALVKAHEGRIDVASRVGEGTVIRLAWPAARAS